MVLQMFDLLVLCIQVVQSLLVLLFSRVLSLEFLLCKGLYALREQSS